MLAASPRVVVAPDKFKGTLTAEEVAAAMSRGVRDVLPRAQIISIPVADGGEGTVDALVAAGATRHTVRVTGPLGDEVVASFARRDSSAYVEAAEACGLQLIDPTPRSALQASSRGVGELVLAALDLGCSRVVVALGGVATTDGGAGMLVALGARLLDREGETVHPCGGASLPRVQTVDSTGLDPRLRDVELIAATDVRNPLLGPNGAAAVYAPQKGALPGDVEVLAAALEGWAEAVREESGRDVAAVPGAGAAGGLGAGVLALGGRVESGVELILEAVRAADLLDGADLLITGEGKLDGQSLEGKAPVGTALLAARYGVPALAVAGSVCIPEERWASVFAGARSLSEEVGPTQSFADPAASVRQVTSRAVQALIESASRTSASGASAAD